MRLYSEYSKIFTAIQAIGPRKNTNNFVTAAMEAVFVLRHDRDAPVTRQCYNFVPPAAGAI